MKMKCPGQDRRFWTSMDIFQTPCPVCGKNVEFFKDDISRKCPECGARYKNPRLDLGCSKWCAHAKECIDYDYDQDEHEENAEPASEQS